MKGRHIFFTILTIILPFVLLMNSVLLVFTPEFLTFEYKQPDFPDDPYGFTLEERTKYGTDSVNYITDALLKYSDDYLEKYEMDDGELLYNERETSHMRDVKVVFQSARLALAILIIFIILTIFLVFQNPDSLAGFLKALLRGSVLTLALIAAAIVMILTGFDAFFEGFHHIFFSGDSWLFYASDSLIRLFPEPLWVNGFILAGILTTIFAVLILLIAVLALRKLSQLHAKRKA